MGRLCYLIAMKCHIYDLAQAVSASPKFITIQIVGSFHPLNFNELDFLQMFYALAETGNHSVLWIRMSALTVLILQSTVEKSTI